MKKKSWTLRGVLTGAFLYAAAVTAAAQDGAAAPSSDLRSTKDRDDAVKTVPTWESYGAADSETLEETFFRLSRDFVTTTDEANRHLGYVPIWPRGDIKIAGFRIMPYLREAVEWEYNYFKQPATGKGSNEQGREPQWTHINEAGLLADTALMGGRLQIVGSVDSTWNVRYGSNSPPDTWDNTSNIGATYRWPTGVWVSVGYAFERRHDPADIPPIANDFGRNTNDVFINWGLDHDILFGTKLRFEFGVQSHSVRADAHAYSALDRTETEFFAKASYPFLKDTTRIFALGTYTFAHRDAQSLNDGKTVGLNFGIEGSIPLRDGEYRGLRGQVSVGFAHSLYTNDTFVSGSKTFVSDSQGGATNANIEALLQYMMSPKSTTDLRYSHQMEFSFYGDYQVIDRIDLSFEHTFSRKIVGRIDTYYEHQSPDGRNPQQTIPPSPISQPAPDVNREGVGVGLRYAFNEWMDFDLALNAENRNDHETRSFRNYTGTLGITVYLNALTPKARVAPDR